MQAGVSGKAAAVPQANQRRWGATYPNQIRILFIRYVSASDAQQQLALLGSPKLTALLSQRFVSPTSSQLLSCLVRAVSFPKGKLWLVQSACELQET